MALNLTDEFIRSALKGRLAGVRAEGTAGPFGSVVVDSRAAGPGSLFVALPGERVDGHAFVADAAARGATGALVARPVETSRPVTQYVVDDTLAALQGLAAAWRRQFVVTVVGITGSVGKTTAKELTAGVLARKFPILKNTRNLNSEIGLPLMLFGLDGSQRYAVLEMAMYDVGEIALLCRLTSPVHGIVTNIGPVHMERLGTLDRIAEAKGELPAALPPDGVAFLNGDDPLVSALARRTNASVRRFGLGTGCDVRAVEVASRGLAGLDFTVLWEGDRHRFRTRLAGRHLLGAVLPAIGLGRFLGLTWEEIEAGLNDPAAEPRLRVVDGISGSRILDDSYNASPASVRGALDLLAEVPGRKIAVLGDMRELGSAEEPAHREIGAYAAGRADRLIAVGNLAPVLVGAAEAAGLGAVTVAASKDAVVDLLRRELRSGDHVLVKGSRGLELETIVEALAVAR